MKLEWQWRHLTVKNGTMSDSGAILQSKMELLVIVAPSNSKKWNYDRQWHHLTFKTGTMGDSGAI